MIKKLEKKKIIILCFLLVVAFIVVFGSSYAYFTTTIKAKEFVIYTGSLAVNYEKKTDVISLDNLYPMTNEEGLNLTPHEFTVTNSGNIEARYQIRLELDETNKDYIPLEYINISYKKNDDEYSKPVLLSTLNSSLTFISDQIISPTKSDSYAIKLWIDLSASNDIQGKTFKAKVVIDSIQNVDDGYKIDTRPIITLNKTNEGTTDINLKTNEEYQELGVEKIEDDQDIFITSEASLSYEYYDGENLSTVSSIDTSKNGIYYITYSVTDKSGNTGKSIRIVTINSNSLPSITLNGDSSITLGEKDYYNELGVTVEENNKIVTIGEVKTSTIGTYIVRYIVVDSNNNLNSVIRTVTVNKAYSELILNGTDPVLTSNLIPVKIAEDGTVTKASTLDTWYDYETKNWGNTVVLKEENVIDYSGNNRHAVTTGNPTYSKEGLVLDGNDDSIYIGNVLTDLFKSSNTFQLKVKRDETNVRDILLGNLWGTTLEDESGMNYEIHTNNKYRVYANNGVSDIYNGTANYNRFILITFVFDKDNNKIYVYEDDILVGTMSSTEYGSFQRDFNKVFIGRDSRTGETALKGTIEKVMVYDDILTVDEIRQNINTDYAKIGNNNGVVEDNLLLFYDFRKSSTDAYKVNDTVIPESAIESYFVWIPKYSYQLWDLGDYSSLTTVDNTKPHAIPIKFGLINTSDSNTGECTTPMSEDGTQGLAGESGNCSVGDYMTHPAFLAFDTNGLWVGKFETGYDGATTTATAQVNSSESSKIIIKPNVYSWRYNTVGNMFKASFDYLRNDESHMMKNTEWGALAYLTNSIYGRCNGTECSEVMINNNSAYVTGYAGTTQPTLGYNKGVSIEGNRIESKAPTQDGTYTVNYLNSLADKASSTSNKSGIYDLSGGAWDYVMGYTTGAGEGKDLSGITAIDSDFFTDSSLNKYYDKYSSTGYTQYNNQILGDATGELGTFYNEKDPDGNYRAKSSWYGDYAYFAVSFGPWFLRGGHWHHGSDSGSLAFYHHTGSAASDISFRVVLTPTK